MLIFLDRNSKVIVQGMTGSEGCKHMCRILGAGTNVVGGTNPRKVGASVEFGVAPIGPGVEEREAGAVSVPVLGSVAEAKEATGADVSVVFIPSAHTLGAVIEAVDAGLDLVVVITEDVPVKDATEFYAYATERGARLIGPNRSGIISPDQPNVGITPLDITGPGRVGLVPEPDTLAYQLMYEPTDLGFVTCIGIGSDPVIGATHIDAIKALRADPDTELIAMIGEIGDGAEERAAAYISEHVTKPVVAYVAGFIAPEGKTMGHAGAIVSDSSGAAAVKKEALEVVGVCVGRTPSQTAAIAREILGV